MFRSTAWESMTLCIYAAAQYESCDMNEHEPIPPERLWAAVDVILVVIGVLDEDGRLRQPSALMGTEAQPAEFCEFTLYEIEQAEEFLVRCGLLDIRDDRPSLN